MSDRGDYRAFYCAFWDDADVHALSDRAYRVLTTLKGTLPPSGIGVVYLSQLADRCGCSPAELEGALDELQRPKAEEEYGWIVIERNVAWIVNGLRYEPGLALSNPNHRKFLAKRLLAPLGGRPIVEAFRRYYAEWFSDAAPSVGDTHSDATRKGIRSLPDQKQVASPKPSRRPEPILTEAVASPRADADSAAGSLPAAAAEGVSYAVALVTAANQGITARWGEQPVPLYAQAVPSVRAAEELARHGVPIAEARNLVYTLAVESKQERPPRSLGYWTAAIRERWDALVAQRQAQAAPKPQLVAPVPSGGRASNAEPSFGDTLDAIRAAGREDVA